MAAAAGKNDSSIITPARLALLFLIVVFILAPLFQAAAQTSDHPHFDRLISEFEEGRIFHATFSHEYLDSYTGERTRHEGEIWISRTMYRVESENQIMIVDGEISKVYDGLRNRLLISEYIEEEDDFAPSRMLQGVDDTYRVEEETDNNGPSIHLVTDDPFAIFTRVTIYLDSRGRPEGIEAVDQVENQLITLFSGGEFIEEEAGLFEMEIPEDAERIDLRH